MKLITVNSLHPGTYLDTNMVRKANVSPMGKAETGADAEVYLATSPGLKWVRCFLRCYSLFETTM